MSSINPHYTFNYSQPAEHRFSHDSVFMSRRIFEILAPEPLGNWRMLDLCAGCGVVGLDFLFHLQEAGLQVPAACDFLDVQEIYIPHFLKNAQAIPNANLRFLNQNYSSLMANGERYDLILCNPPFFRPGHGELSLNEFKNRCRFFLDSDFLTLLKSITHSLKPSGRAYLLLRDLREHGMDVEKEAREILGPDCEMQKAGEIRGTSLISIAFK